MYCNHEYFIDMTAMKAITRASGVHFEINYEDIEKRQCSVSESLTQSYKEVQLMREGKIPKKTWREYRADQCKGGVPKCTYPWASGSCTGSGKLLQFSYEIGISMSVDPALDQGK